MIKIDKVFHELIRVAIGTQDNLSRLPSNKEWKALYDMAKRQSLVGVCFAGLQRLSNDDHDDNDNNHSVLGMASEDLEPCEVMAKYWNMPEMLYLKWMGMAAKIQQRNEAMNGYTQEVLAHFRKEGFACTILKGQGLAKLYCSLAGLRQSGDVDVWVAGGRKALYDHSIKMFGKLEGLTYHHIHYPMYENVEVEAHVWPSFLSSPLRNKRLQEFCMMYEPKDGCEDTPSLAFNRVFILLHCYQHFTRRGVGMRQLLDYYFVLKEASLQLSPKGKRDSVKWIKKLGMERFAEAMMWVMKEVLGLDEQYLLCEPNEEYGRFLLDEVMETGNMGHADERVDKKQLQSAGGRYLNNLKRDIRIVKICPHEALWEPIWGIYQFAWCKLTKMKYNNKDKNMAKKKICFVVAVYRTAQSFLRDHFTYLVKDYDVHLVANFPSDEEKKFFQDLGLTCHDAPINRPIRLGADFKALIALRKIFKKEKFACVHSVTPKAGLLTAVGGWLAGVPHRVHIYTGQVWATRTGAMRMLLKTMDRMIALFDTNLLVDGQGQRQFLIKEGVLREDNSMVPANGSIAGIKLERYVISEEVRKRERSSFGFTDDDVVYIFLGRLNHDKGIGELYEAFNRIVEEKPNAKLVFYGNDEGNYDQKVDNGDYPNIKRNINYFFPGRTPKPFEALQVGDIYVIPTWREGFGVSVLEAQAVGLPVITSDAYGVVDASVEGVTGLRCKVGDVSSLMDSMNKYYDNPDLRKEHGMAGRKRVEELFNNDIVSKAWVDYYHKMLD